MAEPQSAGRELRLLFASYHCALDPSSGAALSVRDLLRLLSGRGWRCRAFCGPHLDFYQATSVRQLLADRRFRGLLGGGLRQTDYGGGPIPFACFDLSPAGVPVTVYEPRDARPYQEPTADEGKTFLALFERELEQFGPDLLLTYGGYWLAPEVMARARRRGVRVVFWLHNHAYPDARLFRGADAVLVPSRFTQDFYRCRLGLECTALPPPLDWDSVRCPEVRGRYVTFVNPEPNKGLYPFARMAVELSRRRPDVPLLVVEGRGTVAALKQTGLDFDALGNLHLMATTPDPRLFYRVTRLLLAPSLWEEPYGRVAAEALVNGIPVLASHRGGLPEVLEHAGFLFDLPASCTPEARELPPAEAVAPWVETVLRLWDDADAYAAESRRCRDAAAALRPEVLGRRYETFLAGVLGKPPPPEAQCSPPAPRAETVSRSETPTLARAETVSLRETATLSPAISIIMPVHNGAALVERAVRSVLAQTFTDWELLVVDDASTDDSAERVRRLAAGDWRVRVERLDVNGGPSVARNHALRQARAPTIAYLDHDDEYYPDYLALVYALRERADVLVFAYDLVEERPGAPDFGRVGTHNPVPLRAQLLEKNIATPLGVAHSRSLLDQVGLFDPSIPVEHDWDLWKRFHRAGAVFLFTDRKSGLYHVRKGSVSRAAPNQPPG